ncbi:MAG: NHLP bacteriocin export ABC transporter permease/ATPase subunit, partial [Treponema sp.]|nr:NHLP bacteriocin export ABC transporter permease/ATPase subunit [Treponema sp.]
MEKKIFKINNTNYLTLDGSPYEIKVLSGHCYLFLVKKLPDGRTGARHEVANFVEGESFLNISGNKKYDIILTGTNETEVEFSKPKDPNFAENASKWQKEILINADSMRAMGNLRSMKQQRASDYAFSDALANIASVINKNVTDTRLYRPDDFPVVQVFKIVAKHMGGFSIRQLPDKKYESNKSGVQKLAKDNTIRVREVVLRENWYKEDNGHLIGFYKKEGDIDISIENDASENLIPVALIKNKNSSGYKIIDPSDQLEIPVTKKNARQVYPMAIMAYKTMQAEKISIKSICRFVLADIKRDIARFVIIGLLCTLIGLITPLITRNFIDNVIPEAAKSQAVQICFLVFICNISAMIGNLAKYFANMRMETKADSDLEAAVMDRLLKLPVDFFKGFSSGDLAARTMTIAEIRKQIFNIVLSVFMNFIFSFVYLFQCFRFSGYFAKWGILFCIFPIIISALFCFITYKWEKMLIDCQGKIQGMLLQFLNGIEKITNSHSEKRFFAQWSGEYIRQMKIAYSLGLVGIVNSLINTVYPTVVSIIIYYLYGRGLKIQAINGLTTGTFMAFLSAYSSFQGAFLGVAGALLQIRNVIPLSKRIRPILDALPEIESSKPPVDKLRGNIEISHLNFRYAPDAPLVLKDVNMSIREGEFVAIVGTSGAGKSTLMRMLLGFEKAESGAVFFDSQDISAVDIGSLRRQLGVVLQNDTVLQGTILQNIVGSSGLKEADAWEAARKVSFDKDIAEMPMGMFTMIPAGGATLSGGQLQRLIIARAIIRRPSVLIFDEATSALDNITQIAVRKSLDELKVTRIIIAHRLSTIINADKIYVMKDGEVVEQGNYEELM